MVCFKSSLSCTITKVGKGYDKGEESKTDVVVYDGIKCMEIKTNLSNGGNLQATGLAEHTKKADKLFKIGKDNILTKIGMKATFTHATLWDYGTYIIDDIVPIENKGRIHALYIYCNRYNKPWS